MGFRVARPVPGLYQPVPAGVNLNVDEMLSIIREQVPDACMLHAWEKQPKETPFQTPELTVDTLLEKVAAYGSRHEVDIDSATSFMQEMKWTEDEQDIIEMQTRGQHLNQNWHKMRYGLVTASNVRKILHSTDKGKTAENLLKESPLNSFDDKNLPQAIAFGRANEKKALTMFTRSHRYLHRKCSFRQPGLFVSTSYPFLAATPDAIVECKHRHCETFLVEVKCLFADRNSHPKAALKKRNFCEQDDAGKFKVNKCHEYYHQIQCQMAVTGIHKSYLCIYTRKGIESIQVDFDSDFWDKALPVLKSFWTKEMFPKLLEKANS